ncbi:hypothetical protein FP2506_10826 [Fulvimarina pelagi HTCC2506]|uniref:Cytochrome P460 domain-containing protein n=1 Tax=Fulvimarina pelagi HTCC2506 TaxID=314231 RepID=Q0G4T1_9HYPH|nr:cytochrome P460 family protein [Fulvimarina pelagi]EAU43333.1 hypothetical protein FP2506_10826 [Fulvimarina pelagi HTCC2506]
MTKRYAATLLFAGAGLISTTVFAQTPPFGQAEDTDYAEKVWSAMVDKNLAGDGAIHAFPYTGSQPHGEMLETFYTNAEIDGHSGSLIIKRNYLGEEASDVLVDPGAAMDSVTVMFKREDGYDTENQDWFYAKFAPDGSLQSNPQGIPLAGRVAKGNAEAGCIACHSKATGEDFLYTTDRSDW